MKHPTATGNSLLRAYNKAAKAVAKDPNLRATVHDAGFIIPVSIRGEFAEGYQVFVKLVKYSEGRLNENPLTGGLAESP